MVFVRPTCYSNVALNLKPVVRSSPWSLVVATKLAKMSKGSRGIIQLFFITGKFPSFQSNDDIEGLMEMLLL